MRTFDFTPLLESAIGFDNLFGLTDGLKEFSGGDRTYPPYNIEKLSEDDYEITLALAGFKDEDLSIMLKENMLTISANPTEYKNGEQQDDDAVEYLYKGIAKRAFKREFQLADFIRVTDASFNNGLLVIKLFREIPEHKKPRQIDISSGKPALEGKKAS
jgi:molecular chaperone IbpA